MQCCLHTCARAPPSENVRCRRPRKAAVPDGHEKGELQGAEPGQGREQQEEEVAQGAAAQRAEFIESPSQVYDEEPGERRQPGKANPESRHVRIQGVGQETTGAEGEWASGTLVAGLLQWWQDQCNLQAVRTVEAEEREEADGRSRRVMSRRVGHSQTFGAHRRSEAAAAAAGNTRDLVGLAPPRRKARGAAQ